MLVEFRTKNFKNFSDEVVFDLSKVGDYNFNQSAIKNGLVKTSIIYGKNGSGKTNLGNAILDISATITDKNNASNKWMRNLNSQQFTDVEFYYRFKFGDSIVVYKYVKLKYSILARESLYINDKLVIQYNHIEGVGSVNLQGAESLTTNLGDTNISYVKFVRNNTSLIDNEENAIFRKFLAFIDNMLFFSSLEINYCLGFLTESKRIPEGIIENNALDEFQKFLNEAGIEYQLEAIETNGRKEIMCNYNSGSINFYEIASIGTKNLALLFYWMTQLDKVSFVFLDEFDAFYHHSLSKFVVKTISEKANQCVFTTHNTTIMDNDILRPDCYFILEDGKINSLPNLTTKELREAHNIEKMYRKGSFDE